MASPSLSSRPGLLVSDRGEVCRHAEGQGAAASAAAAGAADAAAQQCHHLGEPDGPGRPHPAVSGSKKSRRVAHLHRPLPQPRGQRRCSQCRRIREKSKNTLSLLLLSACFCSTLLFRSLLFSSSSSCIEEMRSLNQV